MGSYLCSCRVRPFCPILVEHSGILSSFKLFLELEPQVRDIIFKFYESKYASCLKMLDEMKVRHKGMAH